ncbi:MAG: hypothetical protein A2X36_09375 [Elusimicrobia bacterium GWA2_69_24]|nr:MAG: hypothetical protein A2X36_09375 [Elusimicrobia bacterium GWA2_69_24]HBL15960.1 hypothetical protein [Elusimicrobiota bacterium]
MALPAALHAQSVITRTVLPVGYAGPMAAAVGGGLVRVSNLDVSLRSDLVQPSLGALPSLPTAMAKETVAAAPTLLLPVSPLAASQGTPSFASKSKSRGKSTGGGMPVESPTREIGPDDIDGLDDLGNPRRDDNRGGPDDVWDGSDNDRGGNAFAELKSMSRKGSRKTPDTGGSRDNGGPDGTDGLDDLGNPRRDGGRGGPDDVWDGGPGNNRGDSGGGYWDGGDSGTAGGVLF